MRLVHAPGALSPRSLLLLAPRDEPTCDFHNVTAGDYLHDGVLEAVQRFRGRVYVEEGNLSRADLTEDGRHIQRADDSSWHLITFTEEGVLAACGRIRLYDASVRYSDLAVSRSAIARSDRWGFQVRCAVERQMEMANERGMRFAEYGGWAVDRSIRCSTEAVRMLLAGYALLDLIGGSIGVATANICHGSASILKRIGGEPLTFRDCEIPAYYEPAYNSQLEILQFDSAHPNVRYEEKIDACRSQLRDVTVIAGANSGTERTKLIPREFQNVMELSVPPALVRFLG